ncbi:MAG: T9SS type A sorting domain-containing protein [Flavobacteriales bacterium]|nr:T9SS type A sorting domain-containing protein [Flavobacteriales bacterium]
MKKAIYGALIVMIGLVPAISIHQAQAQKGDVKISNISVTNAGTDSVDVVCERIEIVIADSSENFFCWNECFIPTVSVSGNWRIGPGETVDDKFIGDYKILGGDALSDTSIIRYRFYVANNPVDSGSVLIAYSATSPALANYGSVTIGTLVGVNDLIQKNEIVSIYPNPAEAFLTIDYMLMDGARDGQVVLRNILGANVYTGLIYGSFGKVIVPVENLNNGVYFCTIVVDGEVQQTRKLVVNH